MRTARSAAIAAVLGGRMLVAGGVDENYERLRSVEALEPVASTWSFLTPFCANASLPSVEAFEPVASTWSAVSPMLEARCEAAAAVLDGTLYVCGGDDRVGGCRINQFARWPSTGCLLRQRPRRRLPPLRGAAERGGRVGGGASDALRSALRRRRSARRASLRVRRPGRGARPPEDAELGPAPL